MIGGVVAVITAAVVISTDVIAFLQLSPLFFSSLLLLL